MTRTAVRPLDRRAVREANNGFYAAHPEMTDADGGRIPIDPSSSDHASLRSEWMDRYVAAQGPLEDEETETPADPVQRCVECWIKFQFLSEEGDWPLAGVEVIVIDPNGNSATRTTDRQGLISIASAVPGAYGLDTLLYGRSLSDTFEYAGGHSAPAPVTASHSPPPDRDPPHVVDEKRRNAESGGSETAVADPDANARRAAALPWSPKAFAIVSRRKVGDGDSLVSLAEEAGTVWEDIAEFNFATSRPDDVNAQLRDLVGCTIRDRRGNYSFSDTDDPGLMYLPTPFTAEGLATNRVHVFRGRPIPRPVKLELQTVDALGYRVGGVSLKLVQVDGTETPVATDDKGYWTDTLVLTGPVDVYHTDGARARYFANRYMGADQKDGTSVGVDEPGFAKLDPMLARRAISEILVPGRARTRRLERRDLLHRRYGRMPVDRKAAKDVAADVGQTDTEAAAADGEAADDATGAVRYRQFLVAVDNVFMLGFDTDRDDLMDWKGFFAGLSDWLDDRHATSAASARGFFVMALWRNELMVMKPAGDGYSVEARVKVDLNKHRIHRNLIGAYAAFEAGRSYPMFVDLDSRSYSFGHDTEGVDRDMMLSEYAASEADAETLRAVMNRLAPRVGVLYRLPHDYGEFVQAVHRGGTGLLENYPSDNGVAARVHKRNVKIAKAVDTTYRAYLGQYIWKIERLKSVRELHEHGPPREPFRFPAPAGASKSQLEDIHDALDTTSYKAWMAVNEVLGDLTDQHTGGSMWFRAKFEASGWQGTPGGQGGAKVSWQLDLGSDGVITKSEKAMEVAVGPDGVKVGKTKAGAQYKVEVNTETGEKKESVSLSLSRGGKSWGFEAASDGEVKLTGPRGVFTSWNARTAQVGVGICLPLHDWVRPEGAPKPGAWDRKAEATLCFGIYFQLLRTEHVLAYLVRAPGFFEQRLIEDVMASNWHSLTGFEHAQLRAIGWEEETWDRRLPDDFPEATKKPYPRIEAHQKVAAVRLGFNLPGRPPWQGAWFAQMSLAQGRARRLKAGR